MAIPGRLEIKFLSFARVRLWLRARKLWKVGWQIANWWPVTERKCITRWAFCATTSLLPSGHVLGQTLPAWHRNGAVVPCEADPSYAPNRKTAAIRVTNQEQRQRNGGHGKGKKDLRQPGE